MLRILQNEKQTIAQGAIFIFKLMMDSNPEHHKVWACTTIRLQTYFKTNRVAT